MEFGILGPLDVTDGAGRGVELGGPKQRELLAMLVIHVNRVNRVVPAGRLVDALWGAEISASVHVTLRTHVSRLRARLAAVGGALVTKAPGYGLFLDPEVVDACRFERLLGVGQEPLAAGQAELAAQLLREALGQWRGPVLDDLGGPVFAEAETARLDGLRLAASTPISSWAGITNSSPSWTALLPSTRSASAFLVS